MSDQTRWWWVRHAPVPDGGFIYGQRDLACDCGDSEIFAVLARELPREAVWLTSHLRRTKETAAAILAAAPDRFAGILPLEVRELAEQHLGEWQGQQRKAFYAARKVGTHTLWFAPADERPLGGESFADLVARVVPAIERLNRDYRGRDIVAVTHGGTIRAALALALAVSPQLALSFSIDNCSLTRLDYLTPAGIAGLWRIGAVNHRPWSRAAAADRLQQNPVALDKA
ncbi:MAG TPA: histidine phosphatase family protein [Hyphomicrobiaceae bacterium]|nr:histidine phosphatase family protein [Hyphomicrobiaceae bacterium]